MKFIDSYGELLPQEPGMLGVYKQIEKAARTSYKSEDKITAGSAQKMVENLTKLGHYACLEHGTIYLQFKASDYKAFDLLERYDSNPYSRISYTEKDNFNLLCNITTNARVIVENHWEDDLKYICDPTEDHIKRYCVKMYCSIGVGREITRHRASWSYMQESTRYCNYSKGKFNNELTFIIPQGIYNCATERASYVDSTTGQSRDYLTSLQGADLVYKMICIDRKVSSWYDTLKTIEDNYNYLTNSDGESYDCKAQDARGILPMDLKSELVMTGFEDDGIHFFNLRSHIAQTGKPHPDLQVLADSLLTEFLDKKYIDETKLYKKD